MVIIAHYSRQVRVGIHHVDLLVDKPLVERPRDRRPSQVKLGDLSYPAVASPAMDDILQRVEIGSAKSSVRLLTSDWNRKS